MLVVEKTLPNVCGNHKAIDKGAGYFSDASGKLSDP
jgi:hypothetical protein